MERCTLSHPIAVVDDTAVDEGFGYYTLYRIYRHRNMILRAVVRRAPEAAVSIATVAVLQQARSWVVVATESGRCWHGSTPPLAKRTDAVHAESGIAALRRVADDLVRVALHGVG
jgi:hypothetical protein